MSLKHSILALLSRGPKTGYDLSKSFDRSAGFFWSATHQQIYKELHEVEALDWVTFDEVAQETKPDKKIYQITQKGKSELKKWALEEPTEKPSKDSFLIKLFVGDLLDTNSLMNDLLKLKTKHHAQLQRYQQIENQYFKDGVKQPKYRRFQYLTLKRGLMYERSWLKWCEDVEEELNSMVEEKNSR